MQMPWETIFEVTNIYAMVCWLILLLAPKREQVLRRESTRRYSIFNAFSGKCAQGQIKNQP